MCLCLISATPTTLEEANATECILRNLRNLNLKMRVTNQMLWSTICKQRFLPRIYRLLCSFLAKGLIGEVVGTYFLIFAGCASIIVNNNHDNVVTLDGIAIVWGLTLLVLIYSLGHIFGAHFNPAVTIAFASTRRFLLIQVNKTHKLFTL
ncbi:nodulin-26-like isoform X2 [Vicia villosa]|uniref:nodulin-26-like isoform X2 n=1 Tax=Vicia villosa TaxID=3911 RepID=UPI00273B000A|nr:nodulin-26-like isoform X2 [Vicia villosa]XP_058788510.1 nodulin-26-like isoform X2 [Vicia villosa]XP_058788511.1 nodulin-26-like isoform X2 [Vicia villosa]